MLKILVSLTAATALTFGTLAAVPATQAAPRDSQQISWKQIKKNNTQTSCWTAINGKVYDVTEWITKHPGGSERILGLCGKNGSRMFGIQHSGQMTPESVLASYQIGVIKKKKKSSARR